MELFHTNLWLRRQPSIFLYVSWKQDARECKQIYHLCILKYSAFDI
jgi:hypothetical protein